MTHYQVREMADFERSMKTYIEFPEARKLSNRFAAIAEKSHQGIFSTICTYSTSKSPTKLLHIEKRSAYSTQGAFEHRLETPISFS